MRYWHNGTIRHNTAELLCCIVSCLVVSVLVSCRVAQLAKYTIASTKK